MARAREVRNVNHVSKVGKGRNGERYSQARRLDVFILTVSHRYYFDPLSFSPVIQSPYPSIRSSRREAATDGAVTLLCGGMKMPLPRSPCSRPTYLFYLQLMVAVG